MSVMVTELYTALRSVGVEEGTAKAAAEAVLSELVTKGDLQIAVAAIKTDMAELKADLIKIQVGTMVAMTAIFGGLMAMLKIFA
jgi:heterodisulfide reductase subunit C